MAKWSARASDRQAPHEAEVFARNLDSVMTVTTLAITCVNLVAGLLCSFFVFGSAWAGDDVLLIGSFLLLGVVVPFVATAVVTHLNLRIEKRWNHMLAWVNAFAYTPIYLLMGTVSIGEAIRRSDPSQLIWLVFAFTTVLVSAGAGLLVRTRMKESVTHTQDASVSPRSVKFVWMAVGTVAVVALVFNLLYAVSYIAEDRAAAPRQLPASSESPRRSTDGDTATPESQSLISNASFEFPARVEGGYGYDLLSWTDAEPGSNRSFIEQISAFAAEGNQHLGMEQDWVVWQDLSVTYQPDTVYVLRVAVGNRPNWTMGGNLSTFTLTDPMGDASVTDTFDASTIPLGTFAEASLSLDTAVTTALVGKTIRIQLSANGTGRSHFDHVRLDEDTKR